MQPKMSFGREPGSDAQVHFFPWRFSGRPSSVAEFEEVRTVSMLACGKVGRCRFVVEGVGDASEKGMGVAETLDNGGNMNMWIRSSYEVRLL